MGESREVDVGSELSMLDGTSVLEGNVPSDGELLRLLFAMLPVGVVAYDLHAIHYANATARALLGVTAEEALSAPRVFRYVAPEDWPLVAERREARRRGETTPPAILRLRHDDGRVVVVSLETLELRRDPSPLFLSVVHDVTERLRLEEQAREDAARKERDEAALRETQKLETLGVLAGGIAHDFNNLLASVYGSLAAARTIAAALPEPARASLAPHLANAEAGATRAAELTRQLLTYGGRAPTEKRPVALAPLLGEIAELMRVPLAKRIALSLAFADDVPCVEGDPSQLRQVAMNLVTNAAEAIAEGAGTVSVTLAHAATAPPGVAPLGRADAPEPTGRGFVVLTVRDDGRGMDEATRARAFEPFFSTKGPGRGLGLATTLGILRGHGARFGVASAPGRGTTVTVAFPAVAAAPRAEPSPIPAADEPDLAGRTVLLVDDERRARFALAFLLRQRGIEVIEAENGHDALAIVTERGASIDAVVMDLTMPRLSGRDAATAMLAAHPRLPIVLTSGYAERALAGYPDRGKIHAFLEKPFREEALVAVLAGAFAARASSSNDDSTLESPDEVR